MSQLCTYCSALTIDHLITLAETGFGGWRGFPVRAFYPHHPSFSDLEIAALEGCAFCLIVLRRSKETSYIDSTEGGTDPQFDDESQDMTMYAAAKRKDVSDVKIAINSSHLDYSSDLADVRVFDQIMVQVGEKWDWQDFGPPKGRFLPLKLPLTGRTDNPLLVNGSRFWTIGRNPVDPELGSPANFALARGWLEDCHLHHPACLSNRLPRLPTRVIDVGLAQEGSVTPPKLVESEGRIGRYVALSHCWGKAISPLLTSRTLEAFEDALPSEALPKNFQDAIIITRELGLRYLWIDALCIIQDSKEDWEKESKTMCDVYRNSFVTIMAMASRGCTDGILNSHEFNDENLINYQGEFDDRDVLDPAFIKISKHSEVTVALEPCSYHEDLRVLDMNGPLSKRGWTMQESLLSPRYLYYGVRQLYFRCPFSYQSADGVAYGSRIPAMACINFRRILHSDILRCPSPPPPASLSTPSASTKRKKDLLQEYYDLVSRYSARKLSFDSDKLPAFSGISRAMHREFGGEYLAGLWSVDFNEGLLWSALEIEKVSPYRAPSWSWASTDGNVTWSGKAIGSSWYRPTDTHDLPLRLVKSSLTLRDPSNPFGEITSGYVLVDAPSIPFVCRMQDSSRNAVGRYEFDVRPTEHIPQTGWLLYQFATETENFQAESKEREYLEIGCFGQGVVTQSDCRTCVAILVDVAIEMRGEENDADEDLSRPSARGLLVRRVETEFEETYERIGYFDLNLWDQLSPSTTRRWKRRTIKIV